MRALAEIVVGLGFGDEGKGTTIDWLARHRQARMVVRFNGGAQAGHNVVLPDGRHHCFAQFGSGTFTGARTYLSQHMLINPIFALTEARVLEGKHVPGPMSLLTVHQDALVTTPMHVSMNRIREMLRTHRHGSCGMGIGETVADSLYDHGDTIRVRDLLDLPTLRSKLRRLHRRKLDELAMLLDECGRPGFVTDRYMTELAIVTSTEILGLIAERYASFISQVEVVDDAWLPREFTRGPVLFEGAQGVLLDETYGFHPHTTWSDCTFRKAVDLIGDADVEIKRYGVTRSFATRHGAGPFVSRLPFSVPIEGEHNKLGEWQGDFQVGHLDLVALRYAIDVLGDIDGLVMTWTDTFGPGRNTEICVAYETSDGERIYRLSLSDNTPARTLRLSTLRPVLAETGTEWPLDFVEHVASRLRVMPVLLSSGPTHADKSLVGPWLLRRTG